MTNHKSRDLRCNIVILGQRCLSFCIASVKENLSLRLISSISSSFEIFVSHLASVNMFTCENCHRPFKAESSLLRHISHRETCKDYYGKERLDDVKKASNLISKRKWKKAHSSELKSKYKKDEKLAKKTTKRYVKSDVGKSTPAGKSFTVFYENVYYEAIGKIEEDKLQGAAYDAVYNFAWDSAIDLTMKSDDYVKTFEANINYKVDEGIREDVDIGLELEKAFDTSFDRLFESEKWNCD